MISHGRRVTWAAVLCAMLSLTACASTEPPGFLVDYSQLKPGREGEARLLYIQPGADFSGYDRIIIGPVTLWPAGDSELAQRPLEEAEELATYLETALRRELAIGFSVRFAGSRAIEGEPQAGTLHLRTAITEAQRSGLARIEVEVLDALSWTRLVAAVDERTADDVQESLDYWARVIATRLAVFRDIDAADE